MQINDLFKQTILPMQLAKIKLLEDNSLLGLEQALNAWVTETSSVLLSVPFISKTNDSYLLSVTYMEPTNARS